MQALDGVTLLHPFRRGDEKALFALYSDPALMRYWNTPPWTALAEAENVIEEELAAMASGRYLQPAIRAAEGDALIGLAFGPLGSNRIEADIGPGNETPVRARARLGFEGQ